MKFTLTTEQREFRDAVDALLRNANGVAAARAWAAGDTKPGLDIWRGLAEIGLHSLAVPEEFGGSGFLPVEMCAALERIGYQAAPGPYPESLAASAWLASDEPTALAAEWLPRLAEGAIATIAIPPHAPFAPNADIADLCLPTTAAAAAAAENPSPTDPTRMLDRAARPAAAESRSSIDPTRMLDRATCPAAAESRSSIDPTRLLHPVTGPAPDTAFDTAALLTAAQLLGLGRAALDMTVAYVKQRVQFGRPIGEYQAVKHQLADGLTGLEFARPLVFAAALSLTERDVSAAKAAASDAAHKAARAALQLHGAIGYTDEYDLSVYFKKIRALYGAWGSPSFHRGRLVRHI